MNPLRPQVVVSIGEDSATFITKSGKDLCRVDRDDDSVSAATLAYESLGIEVIEEESE